ncbi:MAG: alpha/beta hydrolase [Limisphaerales bacterium]
MKTSLTTSLAVLLCFISCSLRAAELAIPDNVTFERDVEYANAGGAKLQLNLARPKGVKGPLPVVLCIHGGGFRAGSREGYNKLCLTLAQRGFVAATISYRLAPTHQFPAAVHDTKAAVRWLRANAARLGIDPARIGVTGGSAGGHLAQFLGVTAGVTEFEGADNPGFSSAVTCVVNVYGPSDFTKSYGKSVDAHVVLPMWLGGDVDTARAKHIQSSPLNWVTPNAAPTLILHGTEDKYVAYEQAVWMRDRLTACGVPVELITLEGAGHGFKGADAEKSEAALIAYFEQRLKKK